MRLDETISLFLGEYSNQETRRSYRYILVQMQQYLGPARPLNRINAVDLVAYSQDLRSRGYSSTTVYKHIKGIRRFFNWAVKLELVQTSPAKAMRQDRLYYRVPPEKIMTDDEFEKIKDFAKWDSRKYALVLFMHDTACRAGGAATLRFIDLDLPRLRASVNEKMDKRRNVWYSRETAVALQHWIEKHPRTNGDYVFSRDGSPISAEAISQIIRRLCNKVGVRSLGSHSIRHKVGAYLAENVPGEQAANIMGITQQTFIANYTPSDEATAEAYARQRFDQQEAPVLKPRFGKKEGTG